MLAQGLIDLGYKVEYSCFFNIFILLLLCQCLAVNGSCLFLYLSAPISRLLLRLTDKWVYCVVTGAFFSLKGAIFAGCNWRNGQSPGACGSQVLAGESNRQQRWLLLDFDGPALVEYGTSTVLSPETGSLHSRSCVVKTNFGDIPSVEQSKGDVF